MKKQIILFIFLILGVTVNAQQAHINFRWRGRSQIATSAVVSEDGRVFVRAQYYGVAKQFLYVTEEQYDEYGNQVYKGIIAFYRSSGERLARLDKNATGSPIYNFDYNWRIVRPRGYRFNKILGVGEAVLGAAIIINDLSNGQHHGRYQHGRGGHRSRHHRR